jgi:hypothetical protein
LPNCDVTRRSALLHENGVLKKHKKPPSSEKTPEITGCWQIFSPNDRWRTGSPHRLTPPAGTGWSGLKNDRFMKVSLETEKEANRNEYKTTQKWLFDRNTYEIHFEVIETHINHYIDHHKSLSISINRYQSTSNITISPTSLPPATCTAAWMNSTASRSKPDVATFTAKSTAPRAGGRKSHGNVKPWKPCQLLGLEDEFPLKTDDVQGVC